MDLSAKINFEYISHDGPNLNLQPTKKIDILKVKISDKGWNVYDLLSLKELPSIVFSQWM